MLKLNVNCQLNIKITFKKVVQEAKKIKKCSDEWIKRKFGGNDAIAYSTLKCYNKYQMQIAS